MTDNRNTSTWKERMVQLWEKTVSTYEALKNNPSLSLILKLVFFIVKMLLSIILRKLFTNLFPNL